MLGSLCLAQGPVELIRGLGGEQPRAHRLLAHQARDAAQRLYVHPRLRLGSGQKEKQPHRLPVDHLVCRILLEKKKSKIERADTGRRVASQGLVQVVVRVWGWGEPGAVAWL